MQFEDFDCNKFYVEKEINFIDNDKTQISKYFNINSDYEVSKNKFIGKTTYGSAGAKQMIMDGLIKADENTNKVELLLNGFNTTKKVGLTSLSIFINKDSKNALKIQNNQLIPKINGTYKTPINGIYTIEPTNVYKNLLIRFDLKNKKVELCVGDQLMNQFNLNSENMGFLTDGTLNNLYFSLLFTISYTPESGVDDSTVYSTTEIRQIKHRLFLLIL